MNSTRNLLLPLIDYTANTTLERSQSGSVVSNKGASGAIVLSLPVGGKRGEHYFITPAAAFNITVRPPAGSSLYFGGAKQAVTKGISADDEAESILVVCDGSGDWRVLFAVGTWTVEV